MEININKLAAVLTHTGKKDIREYANSVLIETVPAGTFIIGTNRNKLFIGKLGEEGDGLNIPQVIIPRATIELAIKATTKGSLINVTPNMVGYVPYTSLTITYPNWRRVIPSIYEWKRSLSTFDPDYPVQARNALRLWHGEDKMEYPIMGNGDDNSSGVMVGVSAFVVMMPLTITKDQEYPKEYPFAV